ncbi:hypothetical protein CC86DRAFT_79903 [Ophiobolus disseminans]|uniref:Six-hairpin glycosidase n=1 Tax=Ophiobolus disseminans TaxID=1469910 RepID=A0A6A6ZNT6_9PLEO|nr:hypothetical protein CC86DRAFT_79903 [Ophiobolus disseminans]
MILAAPFEQFNCKRFYDVPYVRTYRTRMLHSIRQNDAGFGLDFGVVDELVSIKIIESNIALYRFELPQDVGVSIVAQVVEDGSFVQHARATNRGTKRILLPYAFRLNVSLNRASYGQLTEGFIGGPLALPLSQNCLRKSDDTTLRVQNPHLGAQLFSALHVNGESFDFREVKDQDTYDAPLNVLVTGNVCIPPGETANMHASFRLLSDLEHHEHDCQLLPSKILDTILRDTTPRWKLDDRLSTYVLRRNVDYILANCTVPVSASSVAVITDHVALPLGWNRDNGWQVRLLLETHANINDLIHLQYVQHYEEQIRNVARGHLYWVFTKAERPEGFWHRSYLVNGRPKDASVFQLDQQCYPILELCDYLDCFPGDIEFVKGIMATGVVQQVLAVLESKHDTETGLYATEETPGDDAVEYPFHFSSHVLLWRTFIRLHNLFECLKLEPGNSVPKLDEMAAELKEHTLRSFATTRPVCGKRMFAYLTDGQAKTTFYHDANDIPTLFAKEWSFVSSSDEVLIWKNTMEFGFSPNNDTGFCNDGVYGGLGSVHSPGAWTLGYFQELAFAASMDDAPAMQAAWTKISAAMNWDGTFSEAVDPKTAECTSKAWFSWPGAMIGALLIRMRINGQEEVLLGKSTD